MTETDSNLNYVMLLPSTANQLERVGKETYGDVDRPAVAGIDALLARYEGGTLGVTSPDRASHDFAGTTSSDGGHGR